MNKDRLIEGAITCFSFAGLLALTGCAEARSNNANPTPQAATLNSEVSTNSVNSGSRTSLEFTGPTVTGIGSNSAVEIVRLSSSRFLVASMSPATWGIDSSGSLVYVGINYMRNHGCDNLDVKPVDFGTVQVETGTPGTCLPNLKP